MCRSFKALSKFHGRYLYQSKKQRNFLQKVYLHMLKYKNFNCYNAIYVL